MAGGTVAAEHMLDPVSLLGWSAAADLCSLSHSVFNKLSHLLSQARQAHGPRIHHAAPQRRALPHAFGYVRRPLAKLFVHSRMHNEPLCAGTILATALECASQRCRQRLHANRGASDVPGQLFVGLAGAHAPSARSRHAWWVGMGSVVQYKLPCKGAFKSFVLFDMALIQRCVRLSVLLAWCCRHR